MSEAPFTLTIYLAGGQTVTVRCTAYTFSRVVDEHGNVRMEFGYDPVEGDPERLDYLNGAAVIALTVTRSAEEMEAERAAAALAEAEDG